MLVLVCGDRNWEDMETVARRLSKLPPGTKVIHGACRGADTCGGMAARRLGFEVQSFPAEWDKYGPYAGPIRNGQMLDQKPDLVIAFHENIEKSRGTKNCLTQARKRKIPVEIISGPLTEAEDLNAIE